MSGGNRHDFKRAPVRPEPVEGCFSIFTKKTRTSQIPGARHKYTFNKAADARKKPVRQTHGIRTWSMTAHSSSMWVSMGVKIRVASSANPASGFTSEYWA